jgi:oxaloacetate decarboxylase alpha subunit
VDRARTLVPAVKAAIGNRPLEIHAHTTIGQGMLSSLEAAKPASPRSMSASGPGGDGSSLPEANRMLANLEEAGHSVAIDKAALARLTQYWTRRRRRGPPRAAAELRCQLPAPPDRRRGDDHHRAPARRTGPVRPAGAVIAETEQVRAELGYPIMVTPFPQMVMSQALFNVIGDRRYAQVSDQVVRYCLGKFGKPTSPIDPQVLAAIMDRPRARTGARAHLSRARRLAPPVRRAPVRRGVPAARGDAARTGRCHAGGRRSRAGYTPRPRRCSPCCASSPRKPRRAIS